MHLYLHAALLADTELVAEKPPVARLLPRPVRLVAPLPGRHTVRSAEWESALPCVRRVTGWRSVSFVLVIAARPATDDTENCYQ